MGKVLKKTMCFIISMILIILTTNIGQIGLVIANASNTEDTKIESNWETKENLDFNNSTYSNNTVTSSYGYTYYCKMGSKGSCDSNGLYVDNGYLRLNHSDNSNITPITASANFDVVMDFSVDDSTYDLGTTSKYLIFATGLSSTNYGWIGGDNESKNISFKQFINSNMWANGVELAQIDKKRISKDNLTIGDTYTYEVKYENENFKVTLSKDNNLLYTFCNLSNYHINTSQINTFLFGDDNGDAFTSGLTYKHLTVKTKAASTVNFSYNMTNPDNNDDTYRHSQAHDPSVISSIEAHYTNGLDEIVKDYPEDYEEYYNENIPSSITENNKTYTLTTQKKAYYIFGTHFDNERSYDLKNWKQISNLDNITMFDNKSYTIPELRNTHAEFDIMCEWSAYTNGSGDCWAGDMIWNYEHKCWTYYSSVSFGKMQSSIFFASSDNLTSGFVFGFDENDHTDCFVTTSGFTTSNKKHPFLTANIDFRFAGGVNDGYTLKNISKLWDATSSSKYANAIDPCTYYDKNGNLWMSYGSWCNGIWTIPLDETNCVADLPTMVKNTRTYKNNNNTGLTAYDVYHGVKIVNAGSNAGVNIDNNGGEGSFIYYDKDNDFYILTESFAGIGESQGYNLRTYSSNSPDGPFYDAKGNLGTSDATSATHSTTESGTKLMGDYTFNCLPYSYTSTGHNSLLYSDVNGDGIKEYYNVYHARFLNNEYVDNNADQSEGKAFMFNDFIHPAFVVPAPSSSNPMSKSIVTMPYEYSGETMPTAKEDNLESVSKMLYSAKQVSGYYEFINHGSLSSGSVTSPIKIKIAIDKVSDNLLSGTISGDANGTVSYEYEAGYKYPIATITIDGETYKGVFLLQKNERVQYTGQEGSRKETMTFAAIGTENNEIWGSRSSSLPEELNAIDSKLSVSSVIYYHSTESYIYNNGNEISDGSETRERCSYVYINSKYTINNTTVICNPISTINLVLDEEKSTETLKAYKITGNVGPFFYDTETNTRTDGDISLNIEYRDENGNNYSEILYSYVMTQPLETHMSQYIYNTNPFNTKLRSLCYFAVFNDSLGYGGEGNYKYFNIIDNDAKFYSDPGYEENTMEGMNFTKDNNSVTTGSYNYTHNIKGDNGTYTFNSSVHPTAEYFIDKSASENQSQSGYWDGEKYIITMSLYSQQGNSMAQNGSSGRYLDEYVIDEPNSPLSIINTSTFDNTIGSMDNFLTTKSYTNNFLTLTGTQSTTTADGDEMHFKISQGTSPKITALSNFKVKVNLYDKGTLRNALDKYTVDENGEKLVASEYTIETWNNYQLAVRVVNSYLNNFENTDYEGNSTLTIVSNGVTYKFSYSNGKYFVQAGNDIPKEIENASACATTQEAISVWLENYYNDLFPIQVFTDYQDDYNKAMNVLNYQCNTNFTNKTISSDIYTYDSVKALLDIMDNENYASFDNFTTDTDDTNYWRNIADELLIGQTNRNYVADENDTELKEKAKDNYILKTKVLNDLINGLRKKTNYDALARETSNYIELVNETTSFNGTTVPDQIKYDETTNKYYDSYNNTHYTDASWNEFIDAYFQALEFLNNNGDYSVKQEDEGYSYKYTIDNNNEYMYEGKEINSEVNNEEKIITDDTSKLSEKQQIINEFRSRLEEAYNNLKISYYYNIIIPKVVILDNKGKGDYAVSVNGYLEDKSTVNVSPDNEFNMNSTGKNIVKGNISQDSTSFNDITEDYTEPNATGNIVAPITAGSWAGNFNFNIWLT